MKWRWKTKELGHGVSAKVLLYQSRIDPEKQYAVKVYYSPEKHETKGEYKKRVLHEYRVLKMLDSNHFVKVFKYEVSVTGIEIRIFMEKGSSNLKQLLPQIEFGKALCIWKQLCYGIEYLHGINYCHRDLKPENLLLDGDCLKIIDLAAAHECSEDAVGLVGSESYCAPETYSRLHYDGMKTDIWSIGVILLLFSYRALPWAKAHVSDRRYAKYIKDGVLESKFDSFVPESDSRSDSRNGSSKSPVLVPFEEIKRILASEPSNRYRIQDIVTSPWFRKINHCSPNGSCGFDSCVHLK